MSTRIRCAIYTRKSTEEGLELSFNSLEAQREACEAYVKSQQHEGWQAIAAHFDDGGFSGGNIERPALRQLMAEIQASKVNVVVVYKVDRLTRSLADFAKIIEQFDKHGVSFVSVTQQFNTTTSMGRLTLNVLLSFAQFEREVTGERIRDKIAASKKKGMWMGGTVPLGYAVQDRKLIIIEPEAAIVRTIFNEFLRLGSVSSLHNWLRENEVTSRRGNHFYRGALFTMLRNPHYLGLIRHKKETYPGEHQAIIDREVWDKAQALIDSNIQGNRPAVRSTKPSLFTGMIFDGNGTRYSPSHTNKCGRRYRYYTSQAVIRKTERSASPGRIPAPDIEKAVIKRILDLLNAPDELLGVLKDSQFDDVTPQSGFYKCMMAQAAELASGWRTLPAPDRELFLKTVIDQVIVHAEQIEIRLQLTALIQELLARDSNQGADSPGAKFATTASVTCPFRHVAQGSALRLVLGEGQQTSDTSRQAILRAIARARLWYQQIVDGEAPTLHAIVRREGIDASWPKKIFPLAFLSPASTEAILRSSSELMLKDLLANIPMDWKQQRAGAL
jgi:DNA invertase Pin-like site-specific DNA recombinase